ncbi:FUSC family protein [Jiella sp. MQZ9-1]|uniref:FUSC family protein n=1 Tax=Jiella flava TaxID=2816857 RepID=A0A939JQM2_9HYPH|nr:FUSC family protein [Jiella flava]MBO0661023.1 FUSC family protein [Jiella flava]MCD2469671.1 FUSC family protein [Jiella flava]
MISGFSLPNQREWIFSAKTFAASMLALYIALKAGLPRPYWAMATVFIVANPLAGATRSKALYRALGTVFGATAAIVVVPLFVNQPVILSAIVATWTGGLLFLSFLDRTPRAYMFMLSGYSLPLIALPLVGDPASVFDVALARSQEIILGITCTSLVSALVLPQSLGPVVAARVDDWMKDSRGWIRGALTGKGEDSLREIVALAPDVRAVDQLISQLRYDPEMTAVVRAAHELRGRLVMLPALVSSLSDRLAGIRGDDGKLSAEMTVLCWEIEAWVMSNGTPHAQGSRRLFAKIAQLRGRYDEKSDWSSLLTESALARLADLVSLWTDMVTLEGEILAGRKARWTPPLQLANVAANVPHYDFGMMAFAAGSAILGVFAASLIWIFSGWDQGAGFVLIAAVSGSFFATADNPLPLLKQMTLVTILGCLIAGIYVFAVLPQVTTFAGLVVVFAPVYLALPILIARPQTAFIGLLLAVNSATLMTLQEVYSADFTRFVNGAIAAILGALFTMVWMILTRPFGAALAARRLERQGWREIAELAAGRRGDATAVFAGRFFDRTSQLVPRLAGAAPQRSAEIFAEMRVGINVLELRRLVDHRTAGAMTEAIRAVLDAVADHFRRRAETGGPATPDGRALGQIDTALLAIARHPADTDRQKAAQALVGLRRALFAEAPPLAPAPEPDARAPLSTPAAAAA